MGLQHKYPEKEKEQMPMTIQEFLTEVRKKTGKPKGWPGCFKYDYSENEAVIHFSIIEKSEKSSTKKSFRRFDPWGLLFAHQLQARANAAVDRITFRLNDHNHTIDNKNGQPKNIYYYESFLRRVSFIAFNNPDISVRLEINGIAQRLYTKDELFRPQAFEVIDAEEKSRSDDDTPGRLEKDLQSYLFGKGKVIEGEEVRTNERLAIFGPDFLDLRKKGLGIDREFVTGVYKDVKSENNRILPTNLVDIVTINKNRELAIIEIKVNDSQLEVISQILDYALFFRRYLNQLIPVLSRNGLVVNRRKPIACYVVNNRFHPRFNEILRYYRTENKNYGFIMKQAVLGYTTVI